MAYAPITCTKEQYEEIIYSGDAKNKVQIKFNNIELPNADLYVEKITIKSRMIPNGSKTFMLESFISKEIDLIIRDIDISTIVDQVYIALGTYIPITDTWEYVPIGIFNIQDKPISDGQKITVKLRDNSVKFDIPYSAQDVIELNGGSATKLQILQDICSKCGVTTSISSFLGDSDLIGVYDNTITARTYLSYLAGQSGQIPTINRSGELIFVNINSLTTFNIPLTVVESHQNGKKYKISKVIYEDAIIKFESGNSDYDTLFLNSANPYISSQSQVDSILSEVDEFEINSFKTGKVLGNPLIDEFDLISIINGSETFTTLATNILTYNGVMIQTFDTEIGEEARETNITVIGEATFRKYAKTSIDNINAEIIIQAGLISDTQEQTANLQVSFDEISQEVEDNKYATDEFGNIVYDENGHPILISSEVTSLRLTTDGLELDVTKTGNNLLSNSMFYDFTNWGIPITSAYIESPTPPPSPVEGSLWYVTENYETYIAGKIYMYTSGVWDITNLTRKQIDDGLKLLKNVTILDNDETKNNFLSLSAVNLAPIDEDPTSVLTSFPVNIVADGKKLSISFKIKNELDTGDIYIGVDTLNKEIKSFEGVDGSVISEISQTILPDDYKNYTLINKEITIQNLDTLVYGEASATPPTDTNKYWLYNYMLFYYNQNNEMWEVYDNQVTFYDELTGTIYIRVEEMYYPSTITMAEYITKMAMFFCFVTPSYVTEVSIPEPTPYPNCYWADLLTDTVFRAKYVDGIFDSWYDTGTSWTQAQQNGVDFGFPPIVLPSGSVTLGDIKLEYGQYSQWSPNPSESYGRNFYLGERGFEIKKGNNMMFIDEDEIRATFNNEVIFDIDQDQIYNKRVKTEELEINGCICKKVQVGTKKVGIRYEV